MDMRYTGVVSSSATQAAARSNAEVIERLLNDPGAVTARMVGMERGGTRSAYESARRALQRMHDRGELGRWEFWVEMEDTGREEATDWIYARSHEDARQLAGMWMNISAVFSVCETTTRKSMWRIRDERRWRATASLMEWIAERR